MSFPQKQSEDLRRRGCYSCNPWRPFEDGWLPQLEESRSQAVLPPSRRALPRPLDLGCEVNLAEEADEETWWYGYETIGAQIGNRLLRLRQKETQLGRWEDTLRKQSEDLKEVEKIMIDRWPISSRRDTATQVAPGDLYSCEHRGTQVGSDDSGLIGGDAEKEKNSVARSDSTTSLNTATDEWSTGALLSDELFDQSDQLIVQAAVLHKAACSLVDSGLPETMEELINSSALLYQQAVRARELGEMMSTPSANGSPQIKENSLRGTETKVSSPVKTVETSTVTDVVETADAASETESRYVGEVYRERMWRKLYWNEIHSPSPPIQMYITKGSSTMSCLSQGTQTSQNKYREYLREDIRYTMKDRAQSRLLDEERIKNLNLQPLRQMQEAGIGRDVLLPKIAETLIPKCPKKQPSTPCPITTLRALGPDHLGMVEVITRVMQACQEVVSATNVDEDSLVTALTCVALHYRFCRVELSADPGRRVTQMQVTMAKYARKAYYIAPLWRSLYSHPNGRDIIYGPIPNSLKRQKWVYIRYVRLNDSIVERDNDRRTTTPLQKRSESKKLKASLPNLLTIVEGSVPEAMFHQLQEMVQKGLPKQLARLEHDHFMASMEEHRLPELIIDRPDRWLVYGCLHAAGRELWGMKRASWQYLTGRTFDEMPEPVKRSNERIWWDNKELTDETYQWFLDYIPPALRGPPE